MEAGNWISLAALLVSTGSLTWAIISSKASRAAAKRAEAAEERANDARDKTADAQAQISKYFERHTWEFQWLKDDQYLFINHGTKAAYGIRLFIVGVTEISPRRLEYLGPGETAVLKIKGAWETNSRKFWRALEKTEGFTFPEPLPEKIPKGNIIPPTAFVTWWDNQHLDGLSQTFQTVVDVPGHLYQSSNKAANPNKSE